MPYTIKQKEYIARANKRWNFKSGAVRSGKSYVDVTAVIPMRIRKRVGKDGLCLIIGVSKETIERNVLQPMRERYGSDIVGTINSRNIARICGENVYCLGAEKASQVAKLQGASAKYVYGDEVAKWNKEVFDLLKSRLDKPYSCFDGSLNPEHPTHWLKEFIDSDADIYLQEYTIFDNTFLPPEFVANLCKEYEGTVYYLRFILGKWVRAEGSIYRKFADNPKNFYCQIVDTINPSLPYKQFLRSQLEEITIGVDFGGTVSGQAFVATAHTAGYKEIIALKSERHLEECEPNDIDRIALEFTQTVFDMFGRVDNLYWDNAETVLGRGLTHAFAVKYPAVRVHGARKCEINDRIRCTLRLIGAGRFYYTDGCETLKTALSEAVWNKDKLSDERLDDGSTDIDSLDAFEYTFERDIKRLIRAV
ncbi:MAG: terminase family protein [Ruminococcus sp.]|nr:terminase family protein [Ruminococcus sp.]